MSLRVRIVVIVIMLLIIANIIRLMSKKKIDYKYGLGWSLVAIIVLILAAFPGILIGLAKITGVIAPVNMLFFLGFIFSLAIIFSMSKTVSKLQDKINRMSQEIAILRKEIQDKE